MNFDPLLVLLAGQIKTTETIQMSKIIQIFSFRLLFI